MQRLFVDICLQTSKAVVGEEEHGDNLYRDAPEILTQLLRSRVETPNNDQGEKPPDAIKPIGLTFVSVLPAAPASKIYKFTVERFLCACVDFDAQYTVIERE